LREDRELARVASTLILTGPDRLRMRFGTLLGTPALLHRAIHAAIEHLADVKAARERMFKS
jgi:hypothetical protein